MNGDNKVSTIKYTQTKMHRTQQSPKSSENSASIFEEKLLKLNLYLMLEETKVFCSKFRGYDF